MVYLVCIFYQHSYYSLCFFFEIPSYCIYYRLQSLTFFYFKNVCYVTERSEVLFYSNIIFIYHTFLKVLFNLLWCFLQTFFSKQSRYKRSCVKFSCFESKTFLPKCIKIKHLTIFFNNLYFYICQIYATIQVTIKLSYNFFCA